MRSPYVAFGPFCSPCVPGAVTLHGDVETACQYDDETGIRAYAFGHDWFEDGVAPYRVYSVATGFEVLPTLEAECGNADACGWYGRAHGRIYVRAFGADTYEGRYFETAAALAEEWADLVRAVETVLQTEEE